MRPCPVNETPVTGSAASGSKPLKIGDIDVATPVFLAPMSGVTDSPVRRLAAELGAGLVVSEMTASDELASGHRMSRLRCEATGIGPHVVQLAGCETHWMAEGARIAEAEGADIIDINMGCPARHVTGGQSGSALMRDLDHAVSLIDSTIAAVKVPVTLKMRLGWDDRSRNAPELARRAEAAGVKLVTVHGRTRSQFYKGEADWDAIRAVREATCLPLVVNGDITTYDKALAALEASGADAVMIGRGAQGQPWLPGQIGRRLNGGAAEAMPTLATQLHYVRTLYEGVCALLRPARRPQARPKTSRLGARRRRGCERRSGREAEILAPEDPDLGGSAPRPTVAAGCLRRFRMERCCMSSAADHRRPADSDAILDALPNPVLMIGPDGKIVAANIATEAFFDISTQFLKRQSLKELVPFGSPLLALIDQVRSSNSPVNEYKVDLGTPRMGGDRQVDLHVAPLTERPGHIVVMLQERSIADKMDRQLTHRSAARSVIALAAMLAHEIKNPLSGIRGAAQLLEQQASSEDRMLTRLICDEADRIVTLVDRMEVFGDERPVLRGPVNIHSVLDHVKRLAQSGFARNIRFIEDYDPSLPPVLANQDQLIQVFLNLVKNAAEALIDVPDAEIQLTTAFRPGVRLSVPGQKSRVSLPLEFCVKDNGPGVPDDLLPNLFDPFVTTKQTGSGLGLALVAKIVGDHGGIIECESQPRKTTFRVLMPMYSTSVKHADQSSRADSAGKPSPASQGAK
ncbi:nifR3 family TIM-barrel protein [Bradyrhizobium ottawaense]